MDHKSKIAETLYNKPPFQVKPIHPIDKEIYEETCEVVRTDKFPEMPEDQIQKLNEYWKNVVKRKYRYFRNDIPLANLEGLKLRIENGKVKEIVETWGKITYDHFVGAWNSDLDPRCAPIDEEYRKEINPLSFTTVIVTDDNKIPMCYRAENVLGPNKETPIAQGVLLYEKDPLETVLRRLEIEVGIKKEDIEEGPVLLGFGTHGDYGDITRCLHIKTKSDSKEIEKGLSGERIKKGYNKGLHFIDNDPRSIAEYIVNRYYNTTWDSPGNMLLYMMHAFPEEARELIYELNKLPEFKNRGGVVANSLCELIMPRKIKVEYVEKYDPEAIAYAN